MPRPDFCEAGLDGKYYTNVLVNLGVIHYDPIILSIFGIIRPNIFSGSSGFGDFRGEVFVVERHQVTINCHEVDSHPSCHRFNPLPSPISAGLEVHRGDCFKQSYTPMFLQYIILCLILNQKKNTQFPAGSFFHAFYGTKAKAKGRESICTGHVDTPFQLSSTSAQCDHCCLGPETLLQTGFP